MDRVRGAGSVVDYMNLLFCLLFLRGARGPQWENVMHAAHAGNGSDGANALLSHIGEATDELLKHLGVAPGMRERLLRLEPRTYSDLMQVVERAEKLDRGAFRLVLDEYEMRAGLRSGEFFTPRAVVRIMVEIARTECRRETPRAVYDPYARGGEFLVEAVAACGAGKDGSKIPNTFGYGHGHGTVRLANMHLALRGARPGVRLTRDAPWGESRCFRNTSQSDLVLTNPPFNMSDSTGEARIQGTWPYGPPPVGNDNFAYVQHVLEALDEGGSAAVVMPNKAGNSANKAEADIRRAMVERGVVKCVIALPDRLFSSTPVPVSVWILVHPARNCDEVLFLDARGLGTRRKGKRVLEEEDVRAVLTAYRSAVPPRVGAHAGLEWDRGVLSAVVPRTALRAGNCSLSPTDHVCAGQSRQEDAGSAFEKALRGMEACRQEMHDADSAVAPADLELGQPVPTGQRSVKLSELFEIKAGPSYNLLRGEQRTPDGEVPLVFPKNLKNGRIEDPGDRRVPAWLAERLKNYQLQEGDIVCIRSGAMGPPALVRPEQGGWLMSTNLLRLRLREDAQADPEYLLACLGRPEAVAWVRDRATATGAPSISAEALGHQEVVLPSFEEQRRIARALAAIEAQATAHLRFAAAVSDVRAAVVERMAGRR
ncbi:type I restriction-modification system subunit M/S [Streptomyces sp. HB2AG]|uniref:type I restriction-modification system subunit M/S n=1 Tax=Streptomyces sp. HB2AG TaxID=2983400 RepID=UPI0022AA1EE4|nr:type I restriction-modification system subunit M/S [Streptomyces sp. HB2AG]MCZ2526973.1 N-6 DNA methylase [Streptomyces sp. HB2AG]